MQSPDIIVFAKSERCFSGMSIDRLFKCEISSSTCGLSSRFKKKLKWRCWPKQATRYDESIRSSIDRANYVKDILWSCIGIE